MSTKPQPGTRQTRNQTLKYRALPEGTLDVAVASEAPIQRWFGLEVLRMEGVNLTRAEPPAQIPVLVDHENTCDSLVGTAERMYVDGDKLRAVIRLDNEGRGAEIARQIEARLLSGISIGYSVDRVSEDRNEPGTFYVEEWTPYEITITPVPADITVGIHRSKIKGSKKSMKAKRAKNGSDAKAMAELGSQYRDIGGEELACETIKAGGSERDLREAIMAAQQRRYDEANASIAASGKERPSADLGLSSGDVAGFSMARAMLAVAVRSGALLPAHGDPDYGHELAVMEAASQAAERSGSRPVRSSFTIPGEVLTARHEPTMAIERRKLARMLADKPRQIRTLLAGGAGSGAQIVADNLVAGSFIEKLYANSVVLPFATILPGLIGNVEIPRQTGSAVGYWMNESDQVTPTDLSLDQVTLTPKEVQSYTLVSRKLLIQSTPQADMLIRNDFARSIALAVDKAAILGSGASNEPEGFDSQIPSGNVVDLAVGSAANTGAAPTLADFARAFGLVREGNAMGQVHYLMRPRAEAYLMAAPKLGGTDSAMIVENGMLADFGMVGTTTQIPVDTAAGSGTGLDLDAVFAAILADVLVGMWSGIDVVVDPYSRLANRQIAFSGIQDLDIAIRHPESFAKLTHCKVV